MIGLWVLSGEQSVSWKHKEFSKTCWLHTGPGTLTTSKRLRKVSTEKQAGLTLTVRE